MKTSSDVSRSDRRSGGASPSRTSITVAASRGTNVVTGCPSFLGAACDPARCSWFARCARSQVDHVAEAATVHGDGGEPPGQDPTHDCANGRQEQSHADDV